ncbi:MAG: hypothetical protein WDZ28_01045 [Simkaniaceae bacterium]
MTFGIQSLIIPGGLQVSLGGGHSLGHFGGHAGFGHAGFGHAGFGEQELLSL